MRLGGVARRSADVYMYPVGERRHDALLGVELAVRQLRRPRDGGAPAYAEFFYYLVFGEGLRAAAPLARGLEEEYDPLRQLAFVLREYLRRTKQRRHLGVVAAGVHDAGHT